MDIGNIMGGMRMLEPCLSPPHRAGSVRVLLSCALWLIGAAAQAAMVIEPIRIPMPDGVHLAADVFRKVGAREMAIEPRQPVLLEYLPYRKTESRARNVGLYDYFVERGYTVVRVDIRGTGNSEGTLVPHEYSDIELTDGEHVVAWLAAQPWSTGRVGLFGISWGGFNALQLALRQPPALKAVLAVNATERLYDEDVHTIDGIWHVDSWSMNQDLDNARPGAPAYRIDEAYFRDRFDQPPWQLGYLRQQRDGAFWTRAISTERIADIRVPMFLIGGWYDGYRSSVARFLTHARAPLKAIVGPWTHALPHDASPGASIEWRREAVRWFDHFLRGRDNGILREPRLAAFIRSGHGPGPTLGEVPGAWRWIDWPRGAARPSGGTQILHAAPDGSLTTTLPEAAALTLSPSPASGIEAGGPVQWWGDVAPDQTPTDAESRVFDTPPQAAEIEILGLPRMHLQVASEALQTHWMIRLSDVGPDGRVTLITGAAINGNHQGPQGASAQTPQAIVPGMPMALTRELHFTSWTVRKGHRLRLSISNAQWPMFWPTPVRAASTLLLGGDNTGGATRIELPLAPTPLKRRPPPQFAAPGPAKVLPGFESVEAGTASGFGEVSAMRRDQETGEAVVELRNGGTQRYPWGEEITSEQIEHRVSEDDPAHAQSVGRHRFEVRLPGRVLIWEGESELRSDATHFDFRYSRRLFENGVEVRQRDWRERIPRDFQ